MYNVCIPSSTYLSEIDGEIDFIVFHATGEWRTLPPCLGAINGILSSMILFGYTGITIVANLKWAIKYRTNYLKR